MPADRPSREYRLVHEAETGLPLLEPVTVPPGTKPLPRPPATPERTSRAPGKAQSWALVLAAVLGAGGAGPLIQALRGDDQAQAVAALAGQVRELREESRERWAELRAQVAALERRREAEDAAQRARLELVDSYLRQRPEPDVRRAREALAE